MEFERGQIVRALAGRDKDGFFVILSAEKPFVFLCDGKKRTIEKPKRKKMMHVAMTKTLLCESDLRTNKSIRKALHMYHGNACKSCEEEAYQCQNRM